MDNVVFESVLIRQATCLQRLIDDYTDTALMLNSADVARKRYSSAPPDLVLHTTANIPPAFQLSTDVHVAMKPRDLVRAYSGPIPNRVAADYLVRTVSILDAFLEDLYEYLLTVFSPKLDEPKRQRLIRDAWTNDALRKFLIETVGMAQPTGMVSTPSLVMDRYEEWRVLRHAVVHNSGELSDKHIRKLEEFRGRLPGLPGHGAMLDTVFVQDRKVITGYFMILGMRQFAYTFLAFIRDSMRAST